MNETLNALFRSLQSAGLDMDAGQAMDSLWLALRMQERAGAPVAPSPNATEERSAPPGDGGADPRRTEVPTERAAASAEGIPQGAGASSRFALMDDEVDALDPVAGRWLTLERTEALSIGRDLTRALRPLRRRVQVPGRGRLDVEATVRRVIDEFVFLPSFLPSRERWLDVLLVLDHGLSMIVWKETLDAFERVLRTSGAFRTVRSLWLESDAAQATLASRGGGAPVRDALQLPAMAHARSRTVVLVVSDCVSPRWHDGAIPALLAAWGDALPVSLLQVTPDWYWPRTALGDAAEGPLYAAGELPRNSRLSWSSAAMELDGLLPGDAGPFAPIPLAAMNAHDIGRLARLLAGGGDGAVRGALFDLSWRGEGVSPEALTPERRVARFHTLATAEARRLASAFASSPVQTLGMLRLLRRDLLPGSRPFVEAEVVLGGSLRVRQEDASWDAGAALRLDFFDGVGALLQDSATVPDIVRVLRHASRDAAGGSATFSAWLSEPALRESGLEELGSDFAAAAAPVLRRLGGSYARGVQQVAERTRTATESNAPDTMAPESQAPAMNAPVANAPVANAPVANAPEANAPAMEVGGESQVSAEDPATGATAGSAPRGDRPSDANAEDDVVMRVLRARDLPMARWLVGREREVEWLLATTTGTERSGRRVAWVTGEGGIGKSAVLAALVTEWNEHQAPDEAFYWSFARDASVELCLRTIADVASRSTMGREADPTEVRAALLGALAQRRQMLLIFDAIDSLSANDLRRLLDDVALVSGSASTISILLASRERLEKGVATSELHLAPLARDAIDEVIKHAVRDPRFDLAYSTPFPENVREQVLASADLFAALSGGNPAVLLSLLELAAMGISAEELREQFVGHDGAVSPLSVEAFRLANPPFYDIREVRGLLASADALVSEDKLADALTDAERAFGIAEQIGVQRPVGGALIARSLEAMGRINLRLGNREEGTRQLQRALRTAQDAGASDLISELRAFLDDRAPRFDDPQAKAVFHVYGRMAGVFFRSWAQQQARELELEGSVQNLPDGRIRVTASGAQSRLDALEQRLRVGPPGATVTRVTREGEDVATVGADVFLSFAYDDRETASRIGELLEGAGLSVFMDQALPHGGDRWREALDAALDRARCIVMLLTKASVASDWVLRESRRGLQRQILVPVLLEANVPLPIELTSMPLHDLTGWDRSGTSPAYWSLLSSIVAVVGVDESGASPASGSGEIAQNAAPEMPREETGSASATSAEDPDGANASPRAEAPSEDAEQSSAATPRFDLAALDLLDLESPAWVQLATGTFRMGATDGAERERPQHTVGLAAFRISRFPITNRQYERFIKETGITAPAHWRGGRTPFGTRDHPVTNVSWDDATAYCAWLSSQIATTLLFRVQLPTEAQWEYAARGPEGRRYPWGEEPPSKEHANFGRRSGGTVPVDAHPAGATPTGIWDMSGNAWEWCRDWFGAYPSAAVENPTGAARGTVRVIRGGSHNSEAEKLRAAYRANRPPKDVFDRGGFRIVWSPSADTPAP